MKNSFFLKRVSFFCLILLFSGCKSPEKQIDPLCRHLWYFPQAPVPVFVNFTPDGRVLGAIGQERFFAPVVYREDGSFLIDSFAVSRAGNAPAFEKPFLTALGKAESRRFNGKKMELFDRSGKLVMVLTPVPQEQGK